MTRHDPHPAHPPAADPLVIVRDVDSLRHRVADWRRAGLSVALVPTMGALHRGHVALVERGLAAADRVVVTIFVNPTQFNSATDLAAYPRTEAQDFAMLERAGAHLLFAPAAATMYPPGFATTVTVNGLTDVLCGAHRPGHFAGVATVVTKLLLQAGADVALFGEKDFQQLTVIRRLVADLNIPVQIIGVPTVREADGLAMSSRNAYLTAEERTRASALYRAIGAAAAQIARGEAIAGALAAARDHILAAGFDAVDYVEARRADDLTTLVSHRDRGRVFAAAFLGKARLIDNVEISA
ncbi:MAG: pantoate--beta-alanine ligase [Rhodospirillaceae bacterium]|nr:pantoate--beta-alanine ligase [Rhodospirillaceae bacterium]